MTELAMRKVQGVLTPVDEISADELRLVPEGKDLLVTVRSPRNPRQHRLVWALAQKLADACDFLPDREAAMNYLKIKARHVSIVQNPKTGSVYFVPKSISYASLDQAAFARLLNRFVFIICSEILPGIDETALRAEIESMTVGHDRRAA